MLLAMTISASRVAFTACSDDDGEQRYRRKQRQQWHLKSKAITSPRQMSRQLRWRITQLSPKKNVTIYEDFNYKYDLALDYGSMELVPYKRSRGAWITNVSTTSSGFWYDNINIKDIGKISSISDVAEMVEIEYITRFPDAWRTRLCRLLPYRMEHNTCAYTSATTNSTAKTHSKASPYSINCIEA